MSASTSYRGITRNDLLRWGICFVTILSLHGAVAAGMLMKPAEGDTYDEVASIEVDFSTEAYKDAPQRDVAPGEEQMQTDAAPPPQEKAEAKKPDEPEPQPPLPSVEEPDVALETTKTPEKKKEEEKKDEEKTPNATPPVISSSVTTAPTSAAMRTARVVNWKRQIARHLQRSKRYPHEAQARRQHGSTKVHFVISRQGRVISSSVVASSGVAALDQEALELLQRAQPMPLPPAEVGGTEFAFSVPVVFELK
jgi:protein TonB